MLDVFERGALTVDGLTGMVAMNIPQGIYDFHRLLVLVLVKYSKVTHNTFLSLM